MADPERAPRESHAPASHGNAHRSEIHVRVPTLHHLFDPMDPSPMLRKDLQPHVEQFIVSWGRELPSKADISLVLHVDDSPSDLEVQSATEGIHTYFEGRALVERRALRHLFRLGRISLLIAVVVLGLSIATGELLQVSEAPLVRTFGGTLEIGGWVAMRRPLEIFLYEWWPIRADIRLRQRLAAAGLRVVRGLTG